MKIFNYGERAEGKYVVCLGRFEALHVGHKKIICKALELAKKLGVGVMLMTYDEGDNPRFSPLILNFKERISLAESLGVTAVMRVTFDEKFMSIPAERFLRTLTDNIDIAGVCCGFDFRFGKGREGDVRLLGEFCVSRGLPLSVTESVNSDGQKISSSRIKAAIAEGEIRKANEMLGYEYFFSGNVLKGRQDGRKMGFPTANTEWCDGKVMPRRAVYSSAVFIDGKRYSGITNVGRAPTFGVETDLVETHLKGFDGELYGKVITVRLIDFLREQVKFSSIQELADQLQKDLQSI